MAEPKVKNKPDDTKPSWQNYDWGKIMVDYVTDPKSSIKKISKKYEIREATVSAKCSEGKWFAAKKKYQQDSIAKALEKASTKNGDRLASILTVTDRLTAQLEKALDDPEQLYRQFVPETMSAGGGMISTYTDKVSQKLDTKAMKDLLQSVKMIEDLNRSLASMQRITEHNRERREDERLKLEKEKFESEKGKYSSGADEGSDCGIVILPEVQDE